MGGTRGGAWPPSATRPECARTATATATGTEGGAGEKGERGNGGSVDISFAACVSSYSSMCIGRRLQPGSGNLDSCARQSAHIGLL
jgi:hypothetical protein